MKMMRQMYRCRQESRQRRRQVLSSQYVQHKTSCSRLHSLNQVLLVPMPTGKAGNPHHKQGQNGGSSAQIPSGAPESPAVCSS